ncbi:MAG TPA: PRC-barrel domain-containing protein [Pseudolabrys sp.]|nr:PRC-barrel domain-containing protein [Pseudolabrys sp.]
MNKYLSTTAIAAVLGIGLLAAPISFVPRDATAATAATAAVDAQKLIGQTIENGNGDNVGEVESVVIDGDGNVKYVIAGVGGFLGLGEKHVALHWDELTISENGDKVMANVTKEQLEALPEHKFPETGKPGMVYSYDDDVAVNPYIAERTPPAPAASTAEQTADSTTATTPEVAPPATTTEQTADSTTAATPEVAPAEAAIEPAAGIPGMRASEIIGATVNTADGTNIGEISEVIVQSNGSINGVVIDVGGFLGLGEKPVLLGWNDLSFAGNADDVVVSTALSKEQLNSMPTYKTM